MSEKRRKCSRNVSNTENLVMDKIRQDNIAILQKINYDSKIKRQNTLQCQGDYFKNFLEDWQKWTLASRLKIDY